MMPKPGAKITSYNYGHCLNQTQHSEFKTSAIRLNIHHLYISHAYIYTGDTHAWPVGGRNQLLVI